MGQRSQIFIDVNHTYEYDNSEPQITHYLDRAKRGDI